MVHIKNLLLSFLVDDNYFIDVLVALSGNALLVYESENRHRRHIGYRIVVRIEPCFQVVPKLFEIRVRKPSVVKVKFFIERIWPDCCCLIILISPRPLTFFIFPLLSWCSTRILRSICLAKQFIEKFLAARLFIIKVLIIFYYFPFILLHIHVGHIQLRIEPFVVILGF